MNAFVGETRGRLLKLVRRAGLTIGELAEALGISENAVRTHVAAAERDGLVRQAGTQRSTGGKPARVYELAPEAEELFPKAYALVLSELMQTLREEDGDAATLERLRRVGRRLGAVARVRDGEDAERVASAASVLESIGGSVQVVEHPDGWTLRGDGCPLSGVVTRDPHVCALAESLVSEVTGLRTVECCQKGERPRCELRIHAGDKDAPATSSPQQV